MMGKVSNQYAQTRQHTDTCTISRYAFVCFVNIVRCYVIGSISTSGMIIEIVINFHTVRCEFSWIQAKAIHYSVKLIII